MRNTTCLILAVVLAVGPVRAARDFDGSNDKIVTSARDDTGFLGDITICVWANIDTGSAYRGFAAKDSAAGGPTPFDFRTNSEATPTLSIVRANSGGYRWWDGPAVTLGSWHFYCVTASGTITTAPTFYKDASPTTGSAHPVTPGTGTGNPTGVDEPIHVGIRADSVVKMDGKMAELPIWSRILSADEIAAVMRCGPWAVAGPIQFYLPMYGTTDPEPDFSGFNAHGTVTEAARYDHPPGIGVCFQESKTVFPQFELWAGFLQGWRYAFGG